MSNVNISLVDKVSILNKYLETFKNIEYLPFFYKILSISPVDVYELFLGEQHINLPNFISSESFVVIINYLFIDINILYDYLYNKEKKYESKIGNISHIIDENLKEKIKNDTEKIYSNNDNYYGIINIINNNKNNNLVKELLKIYPYFDIEKNNYYKETKFLSIVNFIDILSLMLNKEYSNKDELMDIFIFIIETNIDTINYCINIYKNLKNNTSDNNLIIDRLDYLLNDYSSDTVLTFLKIRSDNDNDYNARFNYKLYGKKIDQKKLNIDSNGIITSSKYPLYKSKIMKLNYNDDDFNYYKKIESEIKPNDDLDFIQKFKDTYKNSKTTSQNYIIPEEDYKYTYIFGPFSEIYDYNYTNKEISNKMDTVINSLVKQKPVLIIGYGASGAGKTSTLIYFNKGKTNDSKNGILVHLCNRMAKEHNFNKIELKCREFYVEQNKTTPNVRYFPNDKKNSVEFIYNKNENIFKLNTFNSDKKFIYNNKYIEKSYPETETIFDDNSSLGEMVIHLIDNDRFVAATTNNPNSSRSHSLIFVNLIKYIKDKNNVETEYKTTIIIGDFAGVENLFDCDSDEFKEKFNTIIRDDVYLDETKKNKINKQIENLKIKLNENPENSEFINSELKKLNKTLLSLNKKEYYHRYPIEDYYSKLEDKYDSYTLDFKFIINNFIKLKFIQNYNENLLKDTLKYPFDFNSNINNELLITVKNGKNNNIKYNENTDKYINYIISEQNSKDKLLKSLINVFKNIKNFKSDYTKYTITDNLDLLILKSIFGISFDKKDTDIKTIFSIKDGSNTLVKYINDQFNEMNFSKKLIKYINYFVEKFNKIKINYDTLNKDIFEKNKNLNYGKEICLIRRNEGVFINDSLKQIRNLINYIIIEKNKYKLTISPPFVNECLNFYCNKDTCFKIKQDEIYNTYNERLNENIINIDVKNNLPFNSIIFNTITEEIGIKVKDLIISVFCVFNISKFANNPPPVPYIDINKIKYLFNSKKYDKLSTELKKITCYKDHINSSNYNNDCILLNYNKQKIKNILTNPHFKDLLLLKNDIEEILNKQNFSTHEQNILSKTLNNLFNLIDNFNSASAIGTLEFVDSLSKYNTITNICNKKNFTKEQIKSFENN